MKKLLIGVLGLFPTMVFGQIQLVPKFTNPDSNLMFVGVDNAFTIVGLKDTRGLSISSSLNSKYSFVEKELIINPHSTGFDTLKVFKKKLLLFNEVYNVEFLGDPTPQLAYTFDTLLTVSRIVASPYVTVRIPKTTNIGPFRIILFECSLIHNKMGRQKDVFSIDGSKLSEQLVSAIRKLNAGDEILFSNLIVEGPDGKNRKLPNFKVTIQ